MSTSPVTCPLPHHYEPDRPRAAIDGGYVCQGHLEALRRNIAEMPGIYNDLGLRLTSLGLEAERVSGSHDPGLTLNDPVADCRDHMRHKLASWARVVVEDRGVTPPATHEIHATASFLTVHTDWLACQPFADEAHAELADLRAEGWRLAYPSGRRRFAIGPCTETREGEHCPGTLIATVADADDLLPSSLDCDTCRYALTSDRWAKLGKHYASAADLATFYRVPIGTIRRWAHEDRWARTDQRIRPVLYDTDDAWRSYASRRVGVAS